VIGRENCPCHIVKKDIDVIGGIAESAISVLAVLSIYLRTWCMHSNMPFACGFLTIVGLNFIPYDLHRYSKYSLNSLPFSYIK
jgi:hypothetical protein